MIKYKYDFGGNTMAEKKQFQSILDYRPQFENIMDALVPDIQFSYSAIMNNSTIQTYFNMIAMEYYGYEYFQLLRLNNLEFKLNERSLNLTVLEMVYNIITQIVSRKWRYSEYIAYDMYILPLRIKKYICAMNYKFIETETATKKPVLKLVSTTSRIVTEELIDQYHDDRLNNIIGQFRSSAKHEIEHKLTLFKNIALFLREGEALLFQKFGKEFAEEYFKNVKILMELKSDKLTPKDKKFVEKNIDDLFNIAMLMVLLMSDTMKMELWKEIKDAEKRRIEYELTQKTIEEANRKLQAISLKEKEVKKIGLKN
ncbi:hypothetical protein [Spiroplasma taiwanense]|uniref:Uncharacterized protein n=1 Tax=Spiroplasma taiwanense CT-1 TaxID=1276220 RepID=S5MB20_9MOLU|nr:hypothetical protein [Spiroplasma taiwanense]AGR40968.1 hypothetical protein STAIW_v1c03080 [Spiroplasma taiwanense CT-1]